MTKKETSSKGDILIVDDTLPNLRVLSTMLTEYGYEVRGVPNGKMALTVVQTAPPDLILLDINMPGLDGYEVCERLKADEKSHDIPVIFMSALDEVLDKVRAFAIGGIDYITKPFQIEEVLLRVKNHLALRNLQKQLQETNAMLLAKTAELEEKSAEFARRNEALEQELAALRRQSGQDK